MAHDASLHFGDGCLGARVTLWKENETPGEACFFVIPKSTPLTKDDRQLRAAMSKRLYGMASDVPVMLRIDGELLEDARYLRDGDRVVVTQPVVRKTNMTSHGDKDPASLIPKEVTVSFIINHVKEVDAISQSVYVDFQLYLTWIDPTIVGIPVEARPPYNEDSRGADDDRDCLWNPQVEVNNDLDLQQLWAVFPAQHQGVETGTVRWGARYRGHVSNPMDLHLFPFDADDFCICVGPKSLDITKLSLIIDSAKHGYPGAIGDRVKDSGLDEWDIGSVNAFVTKSLPSGSGAIYSNAKLEVQVFRKIDYYLWKVLVFKLILIVSCFPVFHQDPLDDFPARQGHTFTLALTVVAFLYVAAETLPKVSYLTVMDKIMLLGFGILFFAGCESFVVFLLAKHEKRDLAEAVDKVSVIVFPIVYVSCLSVFIVQGLLPRYRMRRASRIATGAITNGKPSQMGKTQTE